MTVISSMCSSALSSGRGGSTNARATSFRPLTGDTALAPDHEARDFSRAALGDPVVLLHGLPCTGDSQDALTISAHASCPQHYHVDTSREACGARPSYSAALSTIHFATCRPASELHQPSDATPDQSPASPRESRRVSQTLAQLYIQGRGATSRLSSSFSGAGEPAGDRAARSGYAVSSATGTARGKGGAECPETLGGIGLMRSFGRSFAC